MSGTSLLALKLSLEPTIVKTKKEKDKLGQSVNTVNSVKVHKDFKVSGQIDSKSGISYTSFIL